MILNTVKGKKVREAQYNPNWHTSAPRNAEAAGLWIDELWEQDGQAPGDPARSSPRRSRPIIEIVAAAPRGARHDHRPAAVGARRDGPVHPARPRTRPRRCATRWASRWPTWPTSTRRSWPSTPTCAAPPACTSSSTSTRRSWSRSGIAEQNLIAMAAGLSQEGYIPFPCTFDAFSRRILDQLYVTVAYSNLNVKVIGAYVGPLHRQGRGHPPERQGAGRPPAHPPPDGHRAGLQPGDAPGPARRRRDRRALLPAHRALRGGGEPARRRLPVPARQGRDRRSTRAPTSASSPPASCSRRRWLAAEKLQAAGHRRARRPPPLAQAVRPRPPLRHGRQGRRA